MANNLGSLVVSLEANIAKFTSDMGRAAEQTQQAMNKMNGAINMVKGGIAALGVGISVGAIAALVKQTIDAADNLRDMSQKSGVAVETLNGLGFAAGQAGGSLESVVDAAGKVNKSIVEAAGGNKDTTEAFNKLGISVRDSTGHLKTADVVIAEVADKFKNYADGPAKTAIALRIFGKAGADLIPLLNDGGEAMRENIEYAKKYSGITKELTDGSDNFNDAMGKLSVQQKNFVNVMTTAALPVMQAVLDELVHSAEGSDKFASSAGGLRKSLSELAIAGAEVVFTFKSVFSEMAAWHDQATALGVSFGDMAKGPAAIAVALGKAAVNGEMSWSKFTGISDAYKKDAERARIEHDEFIERLRKSGEATAPEEATTDNAPKRDAPALRAKGDDPTKALMEGRLKAIEAAYAAEQETASFHDRYMQALRSQDIVDLETYEAFKIASIDNGAANAQRAYDEEIAVLRLAKANVAKESERADIDNKIKEVSAKKEKALRDAQQERTLAILGQSAAQSGLNKDLKDWALAQDQNTAQFQFEIDLYGKSTLEANKLTAARRIYLDVEERIRRAQENSSTPINRAAFDAERDKAIAASNALYDQADAKQSDPWFNMTESVRRYSEEASNTGAQIGNAMSSAFQSAEDAFVQFAATGKISFKSLAASILSDLARIAMKKAIAGFVNMAVDAYMGTASSSSSGSSSSGGFGYDYGPLAGTRATGGSVLGNSAYLVGERGPEIFRPTGAGSITPNNAIGGSGGGVTINMELNISDSGASGNTSGDPNQQARALGELITSKVRETISSERRQGGMLWQMQQGRG